MKKLANEAFESHSSSQSSGQQGTSHGDGLQSRVQHLHPVASAASRKEVGHVIATRERSVGDFLAQELTQRAPVTNGVFQQPLLGNQATDLINVVLVHLLALVGEVTSEEGLEEFVQHRVVHAGGPAEVGNEFVLGIGDSPVNGLHDRCVPGVDVTGSEDDLGVGVGFNQFLRESASGPVAHSLNKLAIVHFVRRQIDLPGNHPKAGPIPCAQTRQHLHTWR